MHDPKTVLLKVLTVAVILLSAWYVFFGPDPVVNDDPDSIRELVISSVQTEKLPPCALYVYDETDGLYRRVTWQEIHEKDTCINSILAIVYQFPLVENK